MKREGVDRNEGQKRRYGQEEEGEKKQVSRMRR